MKQNNMDKVSDQVEAHVHVVVDYLHGGAAVTCYTASYNYFCIVVTQNVGIEQNRTPAVKHGFGNIVIGDTSSLKTYLFY